MGSAAETAEFDIRWVAANIPDNIMVLDREGRIQYINYTVPDLTPETVRGHAVWEFVDERYHAGVRACFARIVETGQPDRYETQYVSSGGDVSEWESRVAPARRGDEITGFIVISSNITQRLRDEAERRRLFELSLDLLGVATTDGYFRNVNPTFTDVLGYTAAEFTARPFSEFVHEDDRASTLAAFARLQKGQRVLDFENRCCTKAGDHRVLSWRAISEPALGLIYASARDVTGARRLEAQLRHAQKMDAVGRLAGGVAHDFNNLLLAVLVNADFAIKRLGAHEAVQYLHDIKDTTRRAAELTKKLLAFSRSQTANPRSFRADEVVDGLLVILRRLIPETIEIVFTRGEGVEPVMADRGQFEQILMNLCLNARDAMPAGGRLEISLENTTVTTALAETHPWVRPGRHVLLTVTDSGTGMPTEIRERVFEPFFTTKPPEAGAGLGLATVYGIVQQHHGLVTVCSEAGKGSSFQVSLPATDRAPELAPGRPGGAPRIGSETILVAEDAEPVRRVVVRLLEDAGYRVITAVDGVDAVRLAAAHPGEIHLALLDVVMPRKTGPEAGRELAAARPGLRVLLTTGYADRATLAGVGVKEEDVVKKPFEPEALLELIRSILDERGARA